MGGGEQEQALQLKLAKRTDIYGTARLCLGVCFENSCVHIHFTHACY